MICIEKIKYMTKTLKILCIFLLLFRANCNANTTERSQNASASSTYFNAVLLGYYGRPGIKAMGILGQYTPNELVPKLLHRAKQYNEVLGKAMIVKPVFHLIYGMASVSPEMDGSYLQFLKDDTVMTYINIAHKEGFGVILDIQLGNEDPINAIQKALPYLKYKDVHLAIDPEFEVSNLNNVRPGKVIGHVTAGQVNEVQLAMSKYMQDNGIQGNKILILHSFGTSMIQNQNELQKIANIDLTINLDGYGTPNQKIGTFNVITTPNISNKAYTGFKLFLTKDHPMMNIEQSLGKSSYNDNRLQFTPNYINFQ